MGTDLAGDARARMFLRKAAQALAVIGDRALVDDLAVLVEHADGMLLVAEIKTDGDEWDFRFHGRGRLSWRASANRHCLLI